MKIKTILVTASFFGMVSGIGWAGNPNLQPGGYYNPWVVTPSPGRNGGATIQSETYTGGNPLAPGSYGNPIIIEKDGKEFKIRPSYPAPMKWDEENDD